MFKIQQLQVCKFTRGYEVPYESGDAPELSLCGLHIIYIYIYKLYICI